MLAGFPALAPIFCIFCRIFGEFILFFDNFFIEVAFMSGNKYSSQEMTILTVANSLITGHRVLREEPELKALVLASAKSHDDILSVRPEEKEINISMLQVGQTLNTTVTKSIEKNLSALADKNGVFDQKIIDNWRETLGDSGALMELEGKSVNSLGVSADTDKIHELNTKIVGDLSVNHDYVSFLNESVKELENAELKVLEGESAFQKSLFGYLKDLADYGKKCYQRYETNRVLAGANTMEASRGVGVEKEQVNERRA